MSKYDQQKLLYLDLIETSLPSFLPNKSVPHKDVIDAMEYSLCGGGKRVRGILVLAFYELFGGEVLKHALPFAASLEMVHTYSLIHDDLPCMDDDDFRRGKPACHIAYGESTALLAGDGLLTLAFEVLAERENQNNFTTEQILSAISLLATSSGTKGMIGGQIMDLANEKKKVSADILEKTDLLKTGALITAAAVIGSILGGATEKQQKQVDVFGKKIGLAFQIMDDILDITATKEDLGKPINSDFVNEKTTYITAYGIEKAKDLAKALTDEAITSLQATGMNADFLIKYTMELANRNY